MLAITASGCTAPGPVDNPVGRSLTWYSYLDGDDIRATCEPGQPDRYRLVYNAVFSEQVRSYDIWDYTSQPGGVMETRVTTPVRLNRLNLSLSAPLLPWHPRVSATRLGRDDLDALEQALAASGVFEPAPRGLRLHSDSFYWIVNVCRDGTFHFNAFAYPSKRFESLTFVEVLERLDTTGVPFNPPREVARAPTTGAQCGATREQPRHCVTPPFVVQVGDNGLRGGPLF